MDRCFGKAAGFAAVFRKPNILSNFSDIEIILRFPHPFFSSFLVLSILFSIVSTAFNTSEQRETSVEGAGKRIHSFLALGGGQQGALTRRLTP